jgi:hypothetical protein
LIQHVRGADPEKLQGFPKAISSNLSVAFSSVLAVTRHGSRLGLGATKDC